MSKLKKKFLLAVTEYRKKKKKLYVQPHHSAHNG